MRLLLAWLVLWAPTLCQEPPKKDTPKQEEPKKEEPKKEEAKKEEEKPPRYVALVHGDVYTVTKGVLKGATVLLKDSQIHRVGGHVEIPKDAQVIDVKGKRILPGFIAATARGLGVGYSASAKISDALDPFSENIKLALASGITSAYLEFGFSGGFFGGRGTSMGGANAVVKMTYGDLEGMTLLEPAAVDLTAWVRGTASGRHMIREQFQKACEYLDKMRDYERRKAANELKQNEQPPQAAGVESQVKLLKGETVARITASSVEDIRAALVLVEDFKFKCILMDVDEGWILPEEIGRAHAYCIITPRNRIYSDPNLSRPNGTSIEQAAILKKAGVKFAVMSLMTGVDIGGIPGRDLMNLPLEAAFAIRGGLDEQTALESITITAAEMLGVDRRIGSIEEGKDADLIVLDGDPFDYRTFVDLTFINGKLLYEKDKSPYFSHIKPKK